MKITTREIVENITFSKEEIKAFENLRDAVHECCDGYVEDCERCPLSDFCPGRSEICDFLNYIINYCDDEDED